MGYDEASPPPTVSDSGRHVRVLRNLADERSARRQKESNQRTGAAQGSELLRFLQVSPTQRDNKQRRIISTVINR